MNSLGLLILIEFINYLNQNTLQLFNPIYFN